MNTTQERDRFDHYPRRSEPALDVNNRWHTRGEPGDWQHVCYQGTCPEPSFYYVSAIDGPSYWLLAGPYRTHLEALALVDRVKEIAHENHARSVFYSFGTCRTPESHGRGSANKAGLLPDNPPTAEVAQ